MSAFVLTEEQRAILGGDLTPELFKELWPYLSKKEQRQFAKAGPALEKLFGEAQWSPQDPTERQALFLGISDIREVFYGGAAGGGKSSCLLMAALEHVNTAGYSALLLRRTYADLSKPGALMDRAAGWLRSTTAKWNEQKKQWTFPSGATLTFGYLDTENDKYQFQGCFASGHEMLTENGWKRIEDVQVGEVVATLNPQTREVEYQPVSATQQYAYDGEMVSVSAKLGASFVVTPNHNVWWSSQSRGRGTNYKLKKAEARNIRKSMRIPQWGKWSGVNAPAEVVFPKSRRSPAYTFKWKDFAEFLGWFVAEGHYADRYGGIGLSQTKKDGIAAIEALLTRMDVKWHYDGRKFTFSSVELASHLRTHTGALCDNKRLPRYLFKYRAEDLQPLLRGLMAGDGTWYQSGRNHENGVYKTTSNQLADDVCELALICGFRPTKTLGKPRPVDNRFGVGRPIWSVSLCDKGEADTSLDTAEIKRVPNLDGRVYCVTVPPYHTILIRHNGRVCWSGQSEYQYIGFDELSQFTESQYLYLFSRLRRLATSDIPLRMRSASNPGGVGARWVYKRFIPEKFTPNDAVEAKVWWKEGADDSGREFKRAFIPAKLQDNPHLDREQYEEFLNELDPITREQLLRGDWLISERGDILSMWDEKYHVISWSEFAKVFRQSHIPAHWLLGVYQDVGTTNEHPCVTSWFATAPKNAPLSGSVFLYRGLTVTDWTPRQIAEEIYRLMSPNKERERVNRWRMSHEASSERLAYRREHQLPFDAWATGKTRGIAQLRNALEIIDKDNPHPFRAHLKGRPRLYLVVDDDELIVPTTDAGLARHRAEIPAYHWAVPKSGEAPATLVPYALFNDAIDTIRAGAADYFPLSKGLTASERLEQSLPPELRLDNLLQPSSTSLMGRRTMTASQQMAYQLAVSHAKQRMKPRRLNYGGME